MKGDLNKRFTSNLVPLYVLQLFNYIAPFMIIPLLTRVLPTEEFGAVMIAFAVTQVAFVITDYGFSSSAVAEISRNSNRDFINDKISRIFTAKIFLILICMVMLSCMLLIESFSSYSTIFLATAGCIIAQSFQPIWLFHGLQRMGKLAVYIGITKLLYVILVFCLVEGAGDGDLVMWSWSISNFFGAIISLFIVKKLGYKIAFSSLDLGVKELSYNVQFFISRLAVASYTNASSFLVGAQSLAQSAVYSSAEQGYKAGQSVSAPVAQALFPLMANGGDWKGFLKIIALVFLVLLFIGAGTAYYSDFIVRFVFGDKYSEVAGVLSVFMVTLAVNFLGVVFGYPACAAIDRMDIANKTVVIGAVAYFVLAAVLNVYDLISAMTIAVLVLLTEVFVFIARAFWLFSVLRRS